jgi:hypothetical protein
MPQLFTNNARALLTASITDSATSMVVEASKADLFPTANTNAGSVPAATNWFKVTLQDSTGAVEIVYVRTRTAGSGIFSNVLRGQEGTTALAFSAGTVVGIRLTAADIGSSIGIKESANTWSGVQTFLQTVVGTIDKAVKLATPRSIGGVNFDGSTNIDLPGVNTAGNQNTSGNAATATNATNATKLVSTNWTVEESGGQLLFKYGGVTKFTMDQATGFSAA